MSKRWVAALGAAVLAGMAAAPGAQAGPGSPTTASVALGDSFISGEAGRWLGNSSDSRGSRNGSDRAARCGPSGCSYDPRRVYGSSFDNDCDRSDVAPIRTAAIRVDRRVNLACSGARAEHLWRGSRGGRPFRGEAPQADQLAAVARRHEVKLIVLTVSANDLGFAGMAIDCSAAWIGTPASRPGYCHRRRQSRLEAGLPAAAAGLRKAIGEIRAVMRGAGYGSSQYRLLLMGYASPLPVGGAIRYPQSGWSRLTEGGCPFWNQDATWAKTVATPAIVDNMRRVAAGQGVQFLDVQPALDGRQVCHRDSSPVGPAGPSGARSEWVRRLIPGCCQGEVQESLHPNAYGQRALGRCIELIYARISGNWACRNTPGAGVRAMRLSSAP